MDDLLTLLYTGYFKNTIKILVLCSVQEATVSPWVEVTLSLQEALHHLQCPREERKKGSVNTAIFVSTVKLFFFFFFLSTGCDKF